MVNYETELWDIDEKFDKVMDKFYELSYNIQSNDTYNRLSLKFDLRDLEERLEEISYKIKDLA